MSATTALNFDYVSALELTIAEISQYLNRYNELNDFEEVQNSRNIIDDIDPSLIGVGRLN